GPGSSRPGGVDHLSAAGRAQRGRHRAGDRDTADLRPPGGTRGGGAAADGPTAVGLDPDDRPLARLHLERPGGGLLLRLPGRFLHHQPGFRRLRPDPGRPAGAGEPEPGMIAAAAFSLNPATDVQAMLAYDFMRNAFIAGGCIALASGLVGYFVVLRNQVFTTDALGHVAFTGGLGGLLVGIDLVVGLFGSCLAVALLMGSLGGRGRGRDVVIGTVFAWILGVGVL